MMEIEREKTKESGRRDIKSTIHAKLSKKKTAVGEKRSAFICT